MMSQSLTSDWLGPAPDVRTWLYADAYLRAPERRAPAPVQRFWWREPGLYLPLSCAISRNNSQDLGLDNPTTGGAYTRSYTVTSSSDRSLKVGFFADQNTDSVTGVTYAGSAMTLIDKTFVPGERYSYLYVQLAPATGANNVVISVSPNCAVQAFAADYAGVSQTGMPDAFGNNQTTATSISKAITVVASNCWIVANLRESAGAAATWSNAITTELRASSGGHFADSNGTVGTGSQTTTCTFGGAVAMSMEVASFAPSTGGPAFIAAPVVNLEYAVRRASYW